MSDQLGKYSVIRKLGAGGMAEVFLCKLVGIGGFEKHVVLKKIRADIASDSEFITMFFDEARLAANLSHPNIIQVFEVDQLDGMPYIAMEYARGATLAGVLQRIRDAHRTIEYGHLAQIFAGVCAGLDHAHNAQDASGRALKIVHRDISPQNIIVSLDGTPKIFDFGVAKARGSLSLTGSNQVKGKFAYMAPEQLRAQPVDAKADVFAVGVCLYEAATGSRPFRGGTEAELYARRMEGSFRMPSELAPDIPVELEHMILAAMSADPASRPSAVELGQQLAAFCATGTAYASSTSAVASWLKDLLGEEVGAYETYSSSAPSMTPLPRSAKLPPTMNAVEVSLRRPSRTTLVTGGLALVTVAAVVLALSGVLKRREPPRSAESRASAQMSDPSQADAALRALLDEAQRRLAEKKYKLAGDLLMQAAGFDTKDPELAIRRAELRNRVDIDQLRVRAHEALMARDHAKAIELGNRLLAANAADADARQLVAAAVQAREATAAPLPAAATHTVEVRKPEPVKKLEPVKKPEPMKHVKVAKTSKGAGSGAGSASGSGAGSNGQGSAMGSGAGSQAVASALGSAHAAPLAPLPPPAPGSAAPPPKPALAAQVPRPAIVAPAAPDPGSLDAMPSIARLAVDGSLTTTEVRSALARTMDPLRGCYRAAAKKANKTPEVTIKLDFEIDEGARAGSIRVSGDTLGVGACVKDALTGVRTRIAPDVGTVSVTAMLRFKPTR